MKLIRLIIGLGFITNVPCVSFAIQAPSSTKRSSPIITASTTQDEKKKDESSSSNVVFDSACVANPVVIPPCAKNRHKWQCYYYGNSGSWSNGRPCFLPTGSSGLAESSDGLTSWTKIAGSCEEGALLTPGPPGSWDEVQTGVGDVVHVSKDECHMYYFGGSEEELDFGFSKVTGFRMRIGRAKSYDQGRSWTKDESFIFDYDESEGLFASWPRVVVPTSSEEEKPWKMIYHAFDGKKFRVYGAESLDKGDTWTRTGLVLEGSDSEDAFDYTGIGTRTIAPWRGGLLMVYEGVNKDTKHSLGAAFCEDECGNGKWTKLNDGKPILQPGKGPLGEWTSHVIGTPYLVSLPDGSLRLYHCGKNAADAKMSIGVVVSKSGDILPESWEAV